MYLEGQHVDSGWIRSTFTLTHRVSWQQMLQAVYAAFDYFTEIVIFVDEKSQRIKSRDDVLTIPESSSIAIAGISTVFKVPMSIFFYTQMQFSNVRLKCVSEELYGLDYERYNKMVCPLMNALELAMFRKPAKPSRGHKGSKGPRRSKTDKPAHTASSPVASKVADTGQQTQASTVSHAGAHAHSDRGSSAPQRPTADRPSQPAHGPQAPTRAVSPILAPPVQSTPAPPRPYAAPPIPHTTENRASVPPEPHNPHPDEVVTPMSAMFPVRAPGPGDVLPHAEAGLGQRYRAGMDVTGSMAAQMSDGTDPELVSTNAWLRSRYAKPKTTFPAWRQDRDHGEVPGTNRYFRSKAEFIEAFDITGLDHIGHVGGRHLTPIMNGGIFPSEFRSGPPAGQLQRALPPVPFHGQRSA